MTRSRGFVMVSAALAALAGLGLLAACAGPGQSRGAYDEYVVVRYSDTEQRFDLDVFESLLDTELAADEALQASGLGGVGGNEIGDHAYEVYFMGSDAEAMWRLIEPIFAAAPTAWTTVELRVGFHEVAHTVFRQ